MERFEEKDRPEPRSNDAGREVSDLPALTQLRADFDSDLKRMQEPADAPADYVRRRLEIDAHESMGVVDPAHTSEADPEAAVRLTAGAYYFAEAKALRKKINDGPDARSVELSVRDAFGDGYRSSVPELAGLPPSAAVEVSFDGSAKDDDWRVREMRVRCEDGWVELQRAQAPAEDSSALVTPLERRRPLQTLDEGMLDRGADGLITSVEGQRSRDFVRALVLERGSLYRQSRTENGPRQGEVGYVISIAFDRRTGLLAEGTNMSLTQDPRAHQSELGAVLHPVLMRRLAAEVAEAEARPADHFSFGPERGCGRYPHFSPIGSHSEIAAINRLLWARERAGLEVDEHTLREFAVDNVMPYQSDGVKLIACCANCTRLIYDVPCSAGKFDRYPPPRCRIEEEW